MEPDSARKLFEAELATIEGVLDYLCRRHVLGGDEADSFRSFARMRLMEDDFAVLRKFSGRSSLKAYLSAVLANAYRDYRRRQWGRWRPSAAARRLGRPGVLLDTFLNRDGHPLEEAIALVCSRDDVEASEYEVRRLAALIPRRPKREFVSIDEHQSALPTLDPGDELLRDEALAALDAAVAKLPERDQIMLRLRFWEGMTIASIAKQFGVEQRPLYRRFEANKRELRRLLEQSGLERRDVVEMLDTGSSI